MTDNIANHIADIRALLATATEEGRVFTGVPVAELTAVLDALEPKGKMTLSEAAKVMSEASHDDDEPNDRPEPEVEAEKPKAEAPKVEAPKTKGAKK